METTNILETLREETAPYHNEIEQNQYAKGIMDHSMTIEEYREYLERFYGFIVPLERQFADWPEWEEYDFDFKPRIKADLLEKDLLALSMDRKRLQTIPLCGDLPDVSSFSRTLGCLYVLEGSTLGGQMITRQLRQFLPIDPQTNAHYFNSYGQDVRTRWNEFRELLQRVSAEGADNGAHIVNTAKETFKLLNKWIKFRPDWRP